MHFDDGLKPHFARLFLTHQAHSTEHRLTQVYYPWTNGQMEHMKRAAVESRYREWTKLYVVESRHVGGDFITSGLLT